LTEEFASLRQKIIVSHGLVPEELVDAVNSLAREKKSVWQDNEKYGSYFTFLEVQICDPRKKELWYK
jgi:hypothetical protein